MSRALFQDRWNQLGARAAPTEAQPTVQNNPFAAQPGFLGGFLASTLSSVPELFGAPASQTAMQFRQDNPISGFASQMAGIAVPYMGVFRASQAPRLAAALESGTVWTGARFGMEAATHPVRMGAIREGLRYAPFEASRLVTAGLLYPENFGNVFADVAINSAIAGGVGGLGGFLRAGGRRGRDVGEHASAEMFASPTFDLQLTLKEALTKGGTIDLARQERISDLTREVFLEGSGKRGVTGKPMPYVSSIEGATNLSDVTDLNKLFKSGGKKEGLRKDRFKTAEEQLEVAQQLGFQSREDMAQHFWYPRKMTVGNERGAGDVGSLFDKGIWKAVDEDTLVAKEDGGLFIVAKRLKRGTGKDALDDPIGDLFPPRLGPLGPGSTMTHADMLPLTGGKPAAKPFGSMKVQAGDEWFTAKTHVGGLKKLAPELGGIADATVEAWARWRPAWQEKPWAGDAFNDNSNLMIKAMGPLDYADISRKSKGRWFAENGKAIKERLAAQLPEGTRLRDSVQLQRTVDAVYEAFKPTMFKETQNSMYGKLFGLLRGGVRVAETTVTKAMRGTAKIEGTGYQAIVGKKISRAEGVGGLPPAEEILRRLSNDELQQFVITGNAKVPEADLSRLVSEGQITANVAQAVEQIRAIDTELMSTLIRPALEKLGDQGAIKLLENYSGPRVWREFKQVVTDRKGREVFLADGSTALQAQEMADTVIREAAKEGIELRVKGPVSHILGNEEEALRIMQLSTQAHDPRLADAILRTMRRMAGQTEELVTPGRPSTLKQRTGRVGAPEARRYTHDEVIGNLENHYNKLGRFAAYQTWKERFHSEALHHLKPKDERLYADLMRKGEQYLGIEGRVTNTLNKTLEPLLGPKGATRISNAVNNALYNLQLAIFNPHFALLNALTPVMTTIPMISFIQSVPGANVAKLMHIAPQIAADGRIVGVHGSANPMKILWQAMKLNSSNADPQYRQILQQLVDEGAINNVVRDEFVGPSSMAGHKLRDMWKQGDYGKFLVESSHWMANKSENFARMTSAGAGYLVGKEMLGLGGDQLARFTRRFIEVTNFNYSVVDRSRAFTGPIGSMLGLFKTWQMHHMGIMLTYAGVGLKHGAWKPMAWQMASGLAIGGVGSTPLRSMADGLARWATDDPDGNAFLWLQEETDVGDAVWFGFPALFGVSLQASSELPGTDVMKEMQFLGEFALMSRARALGKAIGSAWQYRQANEQNPLYDPAVRDQLIAATMPRAFSRAFSVTEGEYVKSMSTGYPQVRDVSPASRMLHGIGFNVTEVERMQTGSRYMWENQQRTRNVIQGLGREYALAMEAQDSERMHQVIEQAMRKQVPVSSVLQSAITRERRMMDSDLFSRFDREQQHRYRSALEPGD